MTATEPQARYAPVDDLRMYYEIHGRGRPLAPARRVHDDRPHGIDPARAGPDAAGDRGRVVGYSMGGGIALQLAIRDPELVRKLVVASASFTSDGVHAAQLDMFPSITPELFAGSPIEGDSDGIRLEHAVEPFALRGGGVMGDLAGMPASQVAVLSGTSHFVPPGVGLLDRADWLLAMIPPFLDAPMPARACRAPEVEDRSILGARAVYGSSNEVPGPSVIGGRRGADTKGGRSAMSYEKDPRVDAYIDGLPEWQQAICQEVRELVHAADPEVVETIKRRVQPYFVLDGNICALLAAKDHVNVFLYDGGIVPDPDGIITGGHDNKTARTVAIREGEPINASALRTMFEQIIANNRAGGWRKLKAHA